MLLSIKSISYFTFFPVLHKMFWMLEYQSANGTLEYCGWGTPQHVIDTFNSII